MSPDVRPPNFFGIRTLVVDDNADIRRLVVLVLSTNDDFVVCGVARNGAEAVALAEADQPDLVLLDVLMPVMGGVVALPQIRDVAPEAKVVFLSVLNDWMIDAMAPEGPRPDGVIAKGRLVAHPAETLDELRKVVGRR